MSKKGRHHYIPVFYLKQWAGEDGRICEFSKPYDRVKPRRVHSEGTAYIDGLNTIEGLPLNQEQYLEDVFFKIADDAAARALHVLFRPPPWNFTTRERSGWSRFIVSLMMRNPESLQKHKEIAAAIFKDALPRIEDAYANDRGPNDPPTYAEYAAIHGPNPAGRTIVRVIQGLIDNVDVGRKINSMRWLVLHDPSPKFEILTSDRPLLITNGIGHQNSQIIMPISPFHIFIATNNVQTENGIRAVWQTRNGVQKINERVACQSRKYVFGRDDKQLKFVSRRLGLKYTADPIENIKYDLFEINRLAASIIERDKRGSA
jgi:hypothetical protein